MQSHSTTQPKTLPLSILKTDILDNVLRALNKSVAEVLEVPFPASNGLSGWTDADLPNLDKIVDVHARELAKRINDGQLPQAANVRILMDA